MRIPICHHFWENGENARWLPQTFPVGKLESQIKNDYQALATAQPASKIYGEYTVFFDYRPAKDIFGRKIVPVSFAFYRNFPGDSLLARQIHQALAKAPTSQFWLDLPENSRPANPGRKTKKKPVKLLALLLAVILALGFFFFKSCAPKTQGPPEQAMPAQKAAVAAPNPPGGAQKAPVPLPAPAPPKNAPAAQISLPDICENPDLWQCLLKCPRAFVEKRCRGEIKVDFHDFRQQDEACRPAYGKLAPWSRSLPIFRESPSRAGRQALENFIFGR